MKLANTMNFLDYLAMAMVVSVVLTETPFQCQIFTLKWYLAE